MVDTNLNKSEEIFLASLIGDGGIFRDNKINHVYYQEEHSIRQKDYLLWKLKYLNKLFNFANSPYYINHFDKRTKKIYKLIRIHASDSKRLKKYHNLFYHNKKKILPLNVLYKLSRLGLSIWYQDDGTYNYWGKYCSIATDNFDYKTHKLIRSFLKKRYNIKCRLYEKDKKYNIAFDVQNTKKFLDLIKPYIHKTMIYKLGHLDKNNFDKINETKKKVSNNKKEYYKKNKNKIIKYQKIYRSTHKKKIKERARKYYLKNKERFITDSKRRYLENGKNLIKG